MKKLLAFVLCLMMAMSCVCVVNADAAEEKVTLKVWMAGHISYSSIYPSAAEHPWFQAWSERTGIEIEWIQPPLGADVKQAYNLMLANGDLPDLIYNSDIVDNAASHLENGIIIPLNDYLEEYCPNLVAILEKYPDVNKAYRTDDGQFFCFPSLQEPSTYMGIAVNKTWMEECGYTEAPRTIDELTAMFVAFKEKYNAIPFSMAKSAKSVFMSTYDITDPYGWHRDRDQVVHLSAYEDGYRKAMQLLNSWFEQGLLDPDFATTDGSTMAAKAGAGELGAYASSYTVLPLVQAATPEGTEFNWTAIPYPLENEDDEYAYFQTNTILQGAGTAITTACKNVEAACRFMDYLYSEEGQIFTNYGYQLVENADDGIGYYLDAEGKPQYSNEYLTGPEGMAEYARRVSPAIVGSCPGIKLAEASKGRNSEIMREAEDIWTQGSTESWWKMPTLGASVEEAEEFADLNSVISTYCSEMYIKFITGEVDIDTQWDEYIATLQKMGVERMIQIKQDQLDRYNAR